MTGTIKGKVVDSSNKGIQNITVSADGSGSPSATTDSSGNYTITGVEVGSRTISTSSNLFPDSSQTGTVSDGGTTTINFTLGS